MPLSQVLAYNTEHLIDASAHWEGLADQREEVFGTVHNEARALPWEGQGADAVHQRTGADYNIALQSADNLRRAATIARNGASTLTQMHSRVLYTVEDIQADGFAPTEDLGVVDTRPSTNPAVVAQRQAQAQTYSGQLKAQVADLYTHDTQVGADMTNATAGEGKITFTDFKQDRTDSPIPDPPPNNVIDPDHPFVGDERFGQWENYSPPPYVGATPPPPAFEHRPIDGVAARPGGPSNFYTPGRTWVADSDAPFASLPEAYKFRMTGQDFTSYTRTVTIDGHQQLQRWVANTYEAQRISKVDINGSIWSKNAAGEAGTLLPGKGSLGGLSLGDHFGPWHSITPNQMANLSALNPTATYYIPDGCGGAFNFTGGVPVGGIAPAPSVPVMTAPH
jgi:hypothetical protein